MAVGIELHADGLISGWLTLRVTDGARTAHHECDEAEWEGDPLRDMVALYEALGRGEGASARSWNDMAGTDMGIEARDVSGGMATLVVRVDDVEFCERADVRDIRAMLAALFDEVLADPGFPVDFPCWGWVDESPEGRALSDEADRAASAEIAALSTERLALDERERRAVRITNEHRRSLSLTEVGRGRAERFRTMLERREACAGGTHAEEFEEWLSQ